MIVLYGVVLCCMDLIISNSGNDLSHLYGHGKCLDVTNDIYNNIIPYTTAISKCYEQAYKLCIYLPSRHISINVFVRFYSH